MPDAEVMRFRLAPLSRRQSDALRDENEASFDENGFGLWAVDRIEDGRLLGLTGLGASVVTAVEIGPFVRRSGARAPLGRPRERHSPT